MTAILGRVGVDNSGGMKSSVASGNHLIAEAEEGKAAAVPMAKIVDEYRKRPEKRTFDEPDSRPDAVD